MRIFKTSLLALLCILLVSMTAGNLFAQNVSEDFFKFFKYREIGPTRQSGRFTDFAVPEKQPYTFYASTGSGGLLKTVNNGQSFEQIFDNESVISIGAIAVSQSNPDIVYVGSGEANTSRSTYWGDGVYKSTDGGKTWTNMGLKESHHIGRIVVHPKNSNIVYIAALGHMYTENPERGLYKTTDGGKTWTKSLGIVDHGKDIGVVDVIMDPKNNNTLYASTYDKVRKPWTFNLGGPGSGIYKTTNAGRSWKKLGGGLPTGMLGRIGLDVYEKNPKILYANIENANKEGMSDEDRYQELLDGKASRGMKGSEVWRSDNGGNSWYKTHPDDVTVGGGPGYYYNDVIIDPNDAEHAYVLSTSVHETKDGGKTWGSPFRFGGDNHALWIDTKDSKHMLLGYDHGMGVTWDAGANWYHPDNQSLAQFYAIGVDMEYPYNVYGGLQDNGSVKGPSSMRGGGPIRFEDWERVGGGDGFYNVIDPTDSRWLYNESQFGAIARTNLVTGERKSIRPNIRGLRNNWNSPILISPHDPNTIFFGTNKLLKSEFKGENWQEISPDLTNPDPAKLTVGGRGGDGNIQYSTITTVSQSPIVADVIWVGTDDGNVQVTQDGGKNWTKCNDKISGNPEYWVSRVTASNHFPGTAYISYTGYRRDDFRPFVYKTTDFGKSWRSISTNLPDEPVNDIIEDHKNPNLLFVGSEMAVYVSINGGAQWTKMKNNMPTNGCQDILIHPRENDLVVGTHGRGIYITDITPLQELTPEVMNSNAYLFDIESKIQWNNNNRRNYSAQNFDGESEPNGVIVNYYLGNTFSGDVKVQVFQGARMLNEIEGTADHGLNKITWNMNQRVRERTQAEIKQAEQRAERMRRFGFTQSEGDLKYIMAQVNPGEFTVKLMANGKVISKKAVIMPDHWYDK